MAHSSSASTSSTTPFLSRSRSSSPHDKHAQHIEHTHADEDDLEALGLRTPPPPYLSEKYSRHARRSTTSSLHALTRRPRLLAIVAILSFLAIFALFSILLVSRGTGTVQTVPEVDVPVVEIEVDENIPQSLYSDQVLGAPTESFKDNLRDDVQYITSWIAAGWTNDFMTYVNLLYLAVLTNRTAILPPFAPSHVGSAAGFVPVGEVFDLPRLSASIGVPIIEWSDLKTPGSTYSDNLGCWSIWATAARPDQDDVEPRNNALESHLSLDVSYTPVPASTLMLPRPQFNDPHTRFFPLAALTYPDGRAHAHLPAAATYPSKGSGHTALPDEHLACFDFPYYVGAVDPFEMTYDWSPAWRFVGTHAHWTPRIEGLAKELIRATFGVDVAGDAEGEIPPFISMHVRHGDFGVYCGPEGGVGCFAPVSAYAEHIEEVKKELRESRGIEVTRVLVTSDERDPAWWAAVREMGWEWVDHAELKTEERFGKWYPVLLDAVIQSLGAGFVGTDRSTMSLIAQRRVEDWNAGAAREVAWNPQ